MPRPVLPLAVTLSTAKLDPRFPQTNQTKVRGRRRGLGPLLGLGRLGLGLGSSGAVSRHIRPNKPGLAIGWIELRARPAARLAANARAVVPRALHHGTLHPPDGRAEAMAAPATASPSPAASFSPPTTPPRHPPRPRHPCDNTASTRGQGALPPRRAGLLRVVQRDVQVLRAEGQGGRGVRQAEEGRAVSWRGAAAPPSLPPACREAPRGACLASEGGGDWWQGIFGCLVGWRGAAAPCPTSQLPCRLPIPACSRPLPASRHPWPAGRSAL